MTEAFTEDGISRLSEGQTLTFRNETGEDSFKIMKIKNGRIWAKEITLYRPEDFKIVDKKAKWVNKVGKK